MNEGKPLVSVVIPVFNGANFIGQAIQSVLEQTYKNVEIIVVNDGSTDKGETRIAAQKYGEKIRYFEKDNGGVASALNYGIEKMEGDYFTWLSHDDLFVPTKLELQLKELLSAKDRESICVGNYIFFEEETGLEQNTEFEKYFPLEKITNSLFLLFWEEIHFSSLLFHKDNFKRVGLFDEKLLTSQDNDFIFRLMRGQKLLFVKDEVSKVRLHKDSGTSTKKDIVNMENSILYAKMLEELTSEELINLGGTEKKTRDKINGIIKSMGGTVPEYSKLQETDIIIYGAGQYGRRLNYEMNANGIKPLCFWDNNPAKIGTMIDGVECKKPDTDKGIIVLSQKFRKQLMIQYGDRAFVKEDCDRDLLLDKWSQDLYEMVKYRS